MRKFAARFKPMEWTWLTSDTKFLNSFTVNLHLAEKRADEILRRDLRKEDMEESAKRAQAEAAPKDGSN